MKKTIAKTQPQFNFKPICASVLLAFAMQSAQANPIGATVINGAATFATTGNALTVTNTPGTIINWQGFSIGTNEITRFAQQSASSAVLNRVISNNPSSILGSLQSNGRVFLINPNGIVFGAGSTVDVAGMVASTLNLSNADFLAGRYHFTQVLGAQAISNAGKLTASQANEQSGGQIYLIATNVDNSGIITAPNGEILLAAGANVDLVNTNNPNLRVNITAPAGNTTNVGQLVSSAGSLGLFGAVVKNTGTVNADSAIMQGGKIVFKANHHVEVGGKVSARGIGGGTISVLADMQAGSINVHGVLDASALANGNGGFVDTSAAHVYVADSARITTAALNGSAGTWLIDPLDYTIAAVGGNISGATLSANLGLGNVVIANAAGLGNGDIFVNDAVTWAGGNSLTLNASRNIAVNSAISNTGLGDINLNASGLVTIMQNLQTTGAINVATTGDINQTAGVISNHLVGGSAGARDITLSGANITLAQIQSQRHVVLNATGGVNLLAQGSGGFIDDTFFVYNLPFSFNYFGTSYTQAYITTNGLIMFGSGTAAYTDSLIGLGGVKAISPAWNDWILQANIGKDIRIGFGGSDIKIRYDVARFGNQSLTSQFETVLNSNGVIKFNYGAANASFAGDVTIGISNGTGTAIQSQLMNQPNFSMNNLPSTTFTPNGVGGYTETVSSTNSVLSPQGPVSGSALLGRGRGQVINALGRLSINAGGAINAPSDLSANELSFVAYGGAMFTGTNQFSLISSGLNYTSGNLVVYNTAAPLRINTLLNDGGDIVVDNVGGIEVTGAVDTSGGLNLTAHSPITIRNGASLTAGGNINLTAVSSSLTSSLDVLSIAGGVSSSTGNINLLGGSSVSFASTANVLSSLGNVSASSAYGPVAVTNGARLSAPVGTIVLTSFASTANPTVVNYSYVPPVVQPIVQQPVIDSLLSNIVFTGQANVPVSTSSVNNRRRGQSVALVSGDISVDAGIPPASMPVCN